MTITFLLPGLGHNVPIGGFKVVYEYANRFDNNGHKVNIVYITDPNLKGETIQKHTYCFLKWIYKRVVGFSGRKWFSLNYSIKEFCVPFLLKLFLPNSDCYVATAVSTAINLNRIGFKGKNLVYFIQGYESWGVSLEELHNSYKFNMHKIVISSELEKILAGVNARCTYIPNGFDFSKFSCYIPAEDRNPKTLSMLYHEKEIKGCDYGFEAIRIVKRIYPQLKVTLFGTPPRPTWLEKDYSYYCQPNDRDHNRINNESAIFLAPSLSEGWGLTVGEAMICGQAIVCTAIGGHLEIAKDMENALLSPAKDAQSMASNIIRLIEDDGLRIMLVKNGMNSIKRFSWDNSYLKFEKICVLDKTE